MKTICLENQKFKLAVNLYGGSLVSLFDKVTQSELQWQGDEKFWKYQDVVIFPILGRPDGGYEVEGKSYDCGIAHGVARNEWFSVIDSDENSVLLELKANSTTLSKYPFKFILRLRYELLERGFKLTYIVANSADEEMPFQVGAHLGINLTEGVNKIKFDKVTDIKYFPYRNGKCADKSEVLFHSDGFEITPELYAKHGSLVLDRADSKYCTLERSDGLRLRYDLSDSKALTVWALNNGGRFVCVEPWWGLCDQDSTKRGIWDKTLVNKVKLEPKEFSYSCEIL